MKNIIKKNIPNILTIIRITLTIIFIFIYMISEQSKILLIIIFLIASVTDFLDGMLARLLKSESLIGELLDPIADKLLIINSLVLLTISINNKTLTIATLIIISREFFISYIRIQSVKISSYVKVNVLGKLKSLIQMIGIIILLISNKSITDNFTIFGIIIICISSIISVLSLIMYIKSFITLDRKK